jgi:hypothetical protein
VGLRGTRTGRRSDVNPLSVRRFATRTRRAYGHIVSRSFCEGPGDRPFALLLDRHERREGSLRSGDLYKPSTTRAYREALELHVRDDFGAMRLGDVKRRHVQRLVEDLVADGASPSTVRNAVMPLRVIYRRAIRDELATINACTGIELPANRSARPEIVRPDRRRADRRDPGQARPCAVGDRVLRGPASRRADGPALAGRRHRQWHRARRAQLRPEGPRVRRPDEGARQRRVEGGGASTASDSTPAGVNIKALTAFLGHASITITLDRYGHLLPGSIADAMSLLDAYLAASSSGRGGARSTSGATGSQRADRRDPGRA